MNFPEQIIFRLIDKKTKKAVGNVAVSLVLYAHVKNDYYVGPKISNSEGIVLFQKSECIKEIEASKKFYLMDYVSTLEQCLPKTSIKIKPKEELGAAVKKMRQLRDVYRDYWDCSEEYLKSLEVSDNYRYTSKIYNFSESDLWQNKILKVEIEKSQISEYQRGLTVIMSVILGMIVANYKNFTIKSLIIGLLGSFLIIGALSLFWKGNSGKGGRSPKCHPSNRDSDLKENSGDTVLNSQRE